MTGRKTLKLKKRTPRMGEVWHVPRDGDTPPERAEIVGEGIGDDGHGHSQPVVVVRGKGHADREISLDWLSEFGRREK